MEKAILKVSKDDILKHLGKVSKAVKDKSTLPIYTYILFEVDDKLLTMTGTDTNIQIDSSINILESSGNMSFCVDKSIIDILKTLPEQPINIEVTKEEIPELKTLKVNVNIIHSFGNIVVNGEDPQHFTKMKDVDGKGFEIKASKLKRGLNKTKKFACNDLQKPVATSVFFDVKDDSLTFAATDNKIVSRFIDYSVKGSDGESFILDLNSVNILTSLLDGYDEDMIAIRTSGKNVSFSVSGLRMTSRLTEGVYLKYNAVFRDKSAIELKAESRYLSNVLNRMLNVSDKGSSLIKLSTGLMQTHLSTEDAKYNKSANETIECECSGEIVIGLQGKYILDMLSVIDGSAILSFTDPQKAIQITPEIQEEESSLTILAMPLML